ncbi:hypothetical protein CHUAL_011646 [Chamberlinius hualienensis]
MDFVFQTRFIIVPLCIICLGKTVIANSALNHKHTSNNGDVVRINTAQMDESTYEDYEEENEKTFELENAVEACESEHAFIKMTTGVNPESQLVHLHPSTWVYTTKCKVHRAGKSCRGLDGSVSSCLSKSSWVQVLGRVVGEQGIWRPQWVAVQTSCSCYVKPHFSLFGNKYNYAE